MTAKRSVANFKTSGKARAWQRMLSGRRLDLLDPSPLDIEIEDIAHGIARVPRWNGQTKGPHIYSVAQHTLLVDTLVRQQGPVVGVAIASPVLRHDIPGCIVRLGAHCGCSPWVIDDHEKRLSLARARKT